MENALKKIIGKYNAEIKAVWVRKKELNFLASGKQKEILPFSKRLLKGYSIKVHALRDYFENVFEGDIGFCQLLAESDILYDPCSFIDPIQKIVKTGKIMGTKESYLAKFMKISEHFKNVGNIKYDVMNNVVLLIAESSQAALVKHADKIPPLKKVPEYLERYLADKGLEERYIKWVRHAISDFREIEHGSRGLPSGSELDEMMKKAEEFRERISSLL